MEFKKVAILGAGAVGAYLIRGLSEKTDIDLCVIAEGDRKARLEREGLNINGNEYFPKVCLPEEARGVDLLIVSLKYNALQDALPMIERAVDEHTVVMSLMNGVDSEEIIGARIGMEHMLYALIKVASERKGNSVRFDPATTIGIIYGELDGSISKRVKAVDTLFSGTDMFYRSTKVIMSEIWSKYLLNVSNNQPQAMVGCGVGAYKDSEHVAFLQKKLREEVLAVAAAKGIDVRLADRSSSKGSKVLPRARYSTLQDLDAKRHSEVDMFAGAMIRMGKELGVPTPYNEFTYHMIKALEEKNDGRFDYE